MMKNYTTIKENAEATHVVERSKFIAHAQRVQSREEAEQFIAAIKKEYWDARHNVSAYVLEGGESRCSDDGEPSGTSGMPTLEVILGKGLSNVCIVTTRYFGGILLGTGGLVRAYSKAAAMALEAAGSMEIAACAVFEAEVPYAKIDRLERFFKENACVVESSDYAEQVRVRFYVKEENREAFLQKLTDAFRGEISALFIENAYKALS